MQTKLLKNILLVGSGIVIATSASIFAAQAGTSIQANLINLQQYLKALVFTSNGTPNGNAFATIDAENGTVLIQSGSYAFDFNSHTLIPADFVGGLYAEDGSIFGNGIVNMGMPMSILIGQDTDQGDQLGISIRNDDEEGILGMIEYESTGNQDTAVQVQHQLKVKADGTTISFDDYNVLGYNTILGLGSYGLSISSSSGGNIFTLSREGEFMQNRREFDIVNTSNLFGQQVPFAGTVYQTGSQSYIAGVADLFGTPLAVLEYFDNGTPISYVAVSSGGVEIEALGNSISVYASGIRINDTYNLPNTDGTAGQVLSTDGNGNLQWIDLVIP